MLKNMFTLLILSILGFVNAYFLHWQYKRYAATGQKMFCILGEDCTKVVGSDYGSHFGIKNELYGLAYYLGIALYSIAEYVYKLPDYILYFPMIAGLFATLFSGYLFYLQAKVIKTYCSWCLIAITINILIFVNVILFSGLFK